VLAGMSERTGVLVVRAWVEDERMVVRITGRSDVLRPEETTLTVTGEEAACAAVREWLAAFRDESVTGR
jgi:hypothetical protein